MTYVIQGLDSTAFQPLFGLADADLKDRDAVRAKVDAKPGYPCRITLQEAEPGETVLLLNHMSREGATPYRATHAIYVREHAKEVGRYIDEVPPVFAGRMLSLRGFDEGGMMVDAQLSQPGNADTDLRAMFENPAIHQIDVHNAVRGCFSARARRAS